MHYYIYFEVHYLFNSIYHFTLDNGINIVINTHLISVRHYDTDSYAAVMIMVYSCSTNVRLMERPLSAGSREIIALDTRCLLDLLQVFQSIFR